MRTKIEAIDYLIANNKYANEWSGAGMYEAVVEVWKSEADEFEVRYLEDLLTKAENF